METDYVTSPLLRPYRKSSHHDEHERERDLTVRDMIR